MARLPNAAHTELPWRVHELTRDFEIEDVWRYRMPGAGPDDFPEMIAAMRAGGGITDQPWPARFLFAVRWKLGAIFGWDKEDEGLGTRVTSLRDRLPSDMRNAPRGYDSPVMPLKAVYQLPDESARELANRTCHTVMHLGWAPGEDGDYELRMAVLVKPNGALGRAYMRLITPFRHLVVYPGLTRKWEKAWLARG